MPVVLGANIGLGLTSLMAGMGTWQGRRLAIANLLLKCGTTLLVLLFFTPVLSALAASPGFT